LGVVALSLNRPKSSCCVSLRCAASHHHVCSSVVESSCVLHVRLQVSVDRCSRFVERFASRRSRSRFVKCFNVERFSVERWKRKRQASKKESVALVGDECWSKRQRMRRKRERGVFRGIFQSNLKQQQQQASPQQQKTSPYRLIVGHHCNSIDDPQWS
jgi:hypothetical protein